MVVSIHNVNLFCSPAHHFLLTVSWVGSRLHQCYLDFLLFLLIIIGTKFWHCRLNLNVRNGANLRIDELFGAFKVVDYEMKNVIEGLLIHLLS